MNNVQCQLIILLTFRVEYYKWRNNYGPKHLKFICHSCMHMLRVENLNCSCSWSFISCDKNLRSNFKRSANIFRFHKDWSEHLWQNKHCTAITTLWQTYAHSNNKLKIIFSTGPAATRQTGGMISKCQLWFWISVDTAFYTNPWTGQLTNSGIILNWVYTTFKLWTLWSWKLWM